MKMRASRVLEKLRAGEVASCFKMNLDSPRVAEIVAMSGFDCVWADMEHTGNDWSTIENQIRAAKCYNADTLVRVARGSYNDYIRPLELDASGIMVPHIMSLEDAEQVVKMTRFAPLGRRAVDGGNADGGYCNVDFLEYLSEANRERFVVLQIEDPEPLDELDEIAALEGVDMLFFGPGDFSVAIGAPAQWNHPLIIEAREAVVEACRRHGKWAGTVTSPAGVEELVALGYRFLSVGADVVGLNQYCQAGLRVFESLSLPAAVPFTDNIYTENGHSNGAPQKGGNGWHDLKEHNGNSR